MSIEHQKLLQINALQKKEISTLKSQAADLENQGFKEIEKIDGLEQYGRRQNLEIAGVPQQPNENTNSIVIEVSKLLNVVVPPDHTVYLRHIDYQRSQITAPKTLFVYRVLLSGSRTVTLETKCLRIESLFAI